MLALPAASLVATALVPATGVEISAETATLRNFAQALAPGENTLAALRNSLLLSLGAALVLAAAALPVVMGMRRRAVPVPEAPIVVNNELWHVLLSASVGN